MITGLITVGILAAAFVLFSGFLIINIAWTHKPISVRQMLKEYFKQL